MHTHIILETMIKQTMNLQIKIVLQLLAEGVPPAPHPRGSPALRRPSANRGGGVNIFFKGGQILYYD